MKTDQTASQTDRTSDSHPREETSTADLFERFYGKPYKEITEADIGPGEDVGNEKV